MTVDFCMSCGGKCELRMHDARLRPTCTACGAVTYRNPRSAAIAFIVKAHRLLLVQRRYDPGMGKWGLPGGFIEVDEDPRDTACREALEETGLTISVDRLLDVFYVENRVITIAYAAHWISGKAHAGDDAMDARWFTKDTLPELVFLSTVTLCQRWRDGLI